jgi:hypothetical protein
LKKPKIYLNRLEYGILFTKKFSPKGWSWSRVCG